MFRRPSRSLPCHRSQRKRFAAARAGSQARIYVGCVRTLGSGSLPSPTLPGAVPRTYNSGLLVQSMFAQSYCLRFEAHRSMYNRPSALSSTRQCLTPLKRLVTDQKQFTRSPGCVVRYVPVSNYRWCISICVDLLTHPPSCWSSTKTIYQYFPGTEPVTAYKCLLLPTVRVVRPFSVSTDTGSSILPRPLLS